MWERGNQINQKITIQLCPYAQFSIATTTTKNHRRNINIVQSTKNTSTKPFPEKGLLMDLPDEKFKMSQKCAKEGNEGRCRESQGNNV